MTYETDHKLKCYLDTNQLGQEQMCRAILAADKHYSKVRPRHPRGGRDNGRDIQAIYRGEATAFGAIGFAVGANDSTEQKKRIKKKFVKDLQSAISAKPDLKVFVFFTNINLTIGEKDSLIAQANMNGIHHCDILDRERIRIELDSPDGFYIRYQYLSIALSESEQASFFSRWGDDIQTVISSGFQKLERTLNRVLFLQESSDTVSDLTMLFALDKKYLADDIGHFRVFCDLTLKEPKNNIFSILFGASDKSNRMRPGIDGKPTAEQAGIKHGVCRGQWERYFGLEKEEQEKDNDKWKEVGFGSAIGEEEVEFIQITYNKNHFVRFFPAISLRDLDGAMFLPFVNESLAHKIKAIHIFSNGYKLQEIIQSDITVDKTATNPDFPVVFNDKELTDKWTRIRPKGYSTYLLRFTENTPKRLYEPNQVNNSLDEEDRPES